MQLVVPRWHNRANIGTTIVANIGPSIGLTMGGEGLEQSCTFGPAGERENKEQLQLRPRSGPIFARRHLPDKPITFGKESMGKRQPDKITFHGTFNKMDKQQDAWSVGVFYITIKHIEKPTCQLF